VVINLVSNGCQHGDTVSVVIEAEYLRVIDDGPGIPDEYREQVFQPFFRLDSSRSAATGGSGLGLAIVQQLCQAHGWQIGIATAPQGGTEVWLKYAANA
jgi:two-component system osmolarity sensor histidine kinase EnvZ